MTESGITRRDLLTGAAALGATTLLPGCGSNAKASTTAPSGNFSTEFVIVGAGLAGLACARQLAQAGRDVLVVEARDRVGGRTWNREVTAPGAKSGTIVEIGGQWVGPTQDRVLAYIDELGLSTFKTYNDGNYVDYRNGRLQEYGQLFPADPLNIGLNRIPPTDPAGAAEAGAAIEILNGMAADVPLDNPAAAPDAIAWDSMTFQSWMDQNLFTPGGKSLVQLVIEAVFSVQPRDVSLLHVLFYIHSAGNLNLLINTADGAQDSRVVGGTQLISIRMAEQLGVRVLLNAPVARIEQDDAGVTVRGEGFSVRGKRCVVTAPPALAARIRYQPLLPALRDQMTQRMPMGSVIKLQCVYPTPFWRDAGLAGQATSDTGPVKITFDNSPPDAHIGVMMGFIEGEDGRRATEMTLEQRRQGAIESFVRYFGEQARDPLEYIELSWMDEEWSRGCYGGVFGPGAWLDFGHTLRAPVGRIHWAGTETAEIWNGYLDGAIRSGERAAAELLA